MFRNHQNNLIEVPLFVVRNHYHKNKMLCEVVFILPKANKYGNCFHPFLKHKGEDVFSETYTS